MNKIEGILQRGRGVVGVVTVFYRRVSASLKGNQLPERGGNDIRNITLEFCLVIMQKAQSSHQGHCTSNTVA